MTARPASVRHGPDVQGHPQAVAGVEFDPPVSNGIPHGAQIAAPHLRMASNPPQARTTAPARKVTGPCVDIARTPTTLALLS